MADILSAPEAAPWRELVARSLGERSLESLRSTTVDGLIIEPIYESTPPARSAPPWRPFDAERPWDLRVRSAHPDPATANAELRADLEGGAASVLLAVDSEGSGGCGVRSPADLARALEGVIVEVAPVGLDAGFAGPQAAEWLHAFAKASPEAMLELNLDPLGAFAESGSSPGPLASHMASAAATAARLAGTYPRAMLFQASGRVIHEAGGGDVAELAFMATSAVAYAKAMVEAGLPREEAFGRIVLGLAVDADYFVAIAKLRAARVLWSQIAAACGVEAPARIEARSSRRMLTVRDPWTNMLRLTLAGFGAAVGGADAVVLGAYTDAVGLPTAFARRQSRNTQLVLMEEAHIGRVADPAAGSGYVEALTDQLARAAWALFQRFEAAGGAAAALEQGLVAREVERAKSARAGLGEPRIVGVTAFPPIDDRGAEVLGLDGRSVSPAIFREPGPDSVCPALAPLRLAEAYEARR